MVSILRNLVGWTSESVQFEGTDPAVHPTISIREFSPTLLPSFTLTRCALAKRAVALVTRGLIHAGRMVRANVCSSEESALPPQAVTGHPMSPRPGSGSYASIRLAAGEASCVFAAAATESPMAATGVRLVTFLSQKGSAPKAWTFAPIAVLSIGTGRAE